jgi:7,8-dihydropterin-6-yl-methyl-4-(beta-D-ribofuranosyl)aminobenzene 5'-phosphate synthase
MIRELSITALAENTAGAYDFLGEWGLSLWIEADNHRILYDTGGGRTLTANARLLGMDLKNADALIISHGHFDHTGGIAEVMANGFHGKVYAHPWIFTRRFERKEKPPHKEIGIPARSKEALRSRKGDLIGSSGPHVGARVLALHAGLKLHLTE